MNVKGDAQLHGYDYTQRAYILDADKEGAKLELEFEASEEEPLFNLSLVVNNWGGSDAALELNGKEIPRGRDFRYGIEYDVEGNGNFIVFVKVKAKDTTKVMLSPMD
jgi:hypothetical protein